MKHKSIINVICSIFYTALLLNSGCNASQNSNVQTDKSKAAESSTIKEYSKIVFDKTVLDFGNLSPGGSAKGQFTFKNNGTGVLTITKVSECCGVVSSLDKTLPASYQPGESGVLNIDFSGSVQIGKFSRNPIVHSNDPVRPAFNLTVQADIAQVVVWEPASIKLFSTEDNAGCPKLTIRSLDNEPFSITKFQSTSNCITAKFDPNIKASEFVLEPKVDMEKLSTNPKGTVTIEMNHPKGNVAYISFDLLPEFSISPTVLNNWFDEPLTPMSKSIAVKSNGGKDFEIESVSSEDKTITLKNIIKTDIDKTRSYRIEIEITPPVPSSGSTSNLDTPTDVLTIKIKDGPSLAVTSYIRYKGTNIKSD
jgi:hypothetical protein